MKITTAIVLFALIAIGFYSCQLANSTKVHKPKPHDVEIHENGLGMIYIDKIPPRTVIASPDTSKTTRYFTCKIGFQDSSISDRNKSIELNRYYQYEMYKDWVLLVNGDSLRPVFSQPEVQINTQSNESIIVFEVLKNSIPDTLIYNDSRGYWGKQQVYLNK